MTVRLDRYQVIVIVLGAFLLALIAYGIVNNDRQFRARCTATGGEVRSGYRTTACYTRDGRLITIYGETR